MKLKEAMLQTLTIHSAWCEKIAKRYMGETAEYDFSKPVSRGTYTTLRRDYQAIRKAKADLHAVWVPTISHDDRMVAALLPHGRTGHAA
jgi:hypothetical protein